MPLNREWLTMVGLAIAIPASVALSRIFAVRLRGAVSALDPGTYISVSGVCLAVALLAAAYLCGLDTFIRYSPTSYSQG